MELKTPENIYKFVTNNLSYNYYRVKPDVERLGAKDALANPDEAICTEFTDLFITLARSAGIPAREPLNLLLS
jgi:transglutaminase-like putative cysteine protease